MSRFTPLASGEPDEIDLELMQLGVHFDPGDLERVQEAAAGPLVGAEDDIAAFRAAWADLSPGLPQPTPRAIWWRWIGPAVALAAVALVALGLGVLRPGPDDGVRAMGGLPVDVHATRAAEVLDAPWRLEAGDRLQVAFVAPAEGFVDVWTLQADGTVSVLAAAQPVEAGERFALAGAAQLDDHEGQEWLIVELAPTPRAPAQLERHSRDLLPNPGQATPPARWVLEITRWR